MPNHRHFTRRDLGKDRLVDIQVRPHEFVGRERQPLRKRDIFKFGAAEHLQEAQRCLTRVLDIVRHVARGMEPTSPAW